jgi:chlorite dismutase
MHNPQVPETLDGWSVLHQMFRIDWIRLKLLEEAERYQIFDEASLFFSALESREDGASALVQLLGHKGDLMLIHFRNTFKELASTQLKVAHTRLHDYLVPTMSYVSVVELGMYEMTAKVHQELKARSLEAGSEAFEAAFDEKMNKQRARVVNRLFLEVPKRRAVCFYPMNKRRGEVKNWYSVPFDKRAAMMREHGLIGRQYAGQVNQIISGSIGYDDWEWGVDLFADDPLVFKKLIYEMRFDEASAAYAEFGPFYIGLQFSALELPKMLTSETPDLRSVNDISCEK